MQYRDLKEKSEAYERHVFCVSENEGEAIGLTGVRKMGHGG
jgi:hypothetical protein